MLQLLSQSNSGISGVCHAVQTPHDDTLGAVMEDNIVVDLCLIAWTYEILFIDLTEFSQTPYSLSAAQV